MSEPTTTRVEITYTNRDVDVLTGVTHAQVLDSGVFTANYEYQGKPMWLALAHHEWAAIEATPEEENNE